jgi:hypothetical protein
MVIILILLFNFIIPALTQAYNASCIAIAIAEQGGQLGATVDSVIKGATGYDLNTRQAAINAAHSSRLLTIVFTLGLIISTGTLAKLLNSHLKEFSLFLLSGILTLDVVAEDNLLKIKSIIIHAKEVLENTTDNYETKCLKLKEMSIVFLQLISETGIVDSESGQIEELKQVAETTKGGGGNELLSELIVELNSLKEVLCELMNKEPESVKIIMQHILNQSEIFMACVDEIIKHADEIIKDKSNVDDSLVDDIDSIFEKSSHKFKEFRLLDSSKLMAIL